MSDDIDCICQEKKEKEALPELQIASMKQFRNSNNTQKEPRKTY